MAARLTVVSPPRESGSGEARRSDPYYRDAGHPRRACSARPPREPRNHVLALVAPIDCHIE